MTVDVHPAQAVVPECVATRSGTLRSVITALDVLDCFIETPELGVSQVARRLGIAKSSAHRILATLAERQIVEKDPETGLYHLGRHVFTLGQLVQSRTSWFSLALPELRRLHGATGQSVLLGVLDGDSVSYPHAVGNPMVSSRLAQTGSRGCTHETALGRAIAALDPIIERRLRTQAGTCGGQEGFRAVMEFDAALDAFRRLGVAESQRPASTGLSTLAAPVRTRSGKPIGAVVVAGPTPAMTPSRDGIARLLAPTAARVSHLVGARGRE